ncbi:hypothetical protein [Wolbachia endosymbiont (group A) of Beris morrisii]|uniref:hypothetical protein n=1 Tax=Wolbachia endosymbiont (group A) of Beris morrisii TaxID=3066139 RepID=UPI0033421AFB
MSTNDTQQEHIYNERIQEFFPLFDKKDDPIYNARVDFNTVKFLTERADWDWNEDKDKNKACGVILQECDKTARQELEDKAKEELNKYITSANNINDDVEDKKVSIYGNHASITLEDNKKEFKISEFLNSDFCQKNGISGFSTLHSDGKSGMHGFVAEEGGKKIRHYVVTDGSYEMTLNWYVNGEKCTIKINIDKDGIELIEGNGVTEDQLKANKDVKIGGLFLHEIEFREKGQGKANEMQTSFESTIRNDDIVKDKATHMNRGVGSQTPPLPPLRTSSLPPEKDVFNKQRRNTSAKPVSQDGGQRDKQNNPTPNNQQKGATTVSRSDSGNDLGYGSQGKNPQNKKTPPQVPTRTNSLKKDVFDEQGSGSQKPDGLRGNEQTPNNQQKGATTVLRSDSGNDLGYGSQGKNPQNKKTPPQVPTRTNSLKKDVFDEQGSGSQKPDDLRGNEQTPNNQQKGATTVSRSDSRDNYDFPSSDPSDSSTFTKSVSHNQDNRQEDERYDNPTFGHAVPGSRKPDRSEQTPNDQQKGATSDPSDSSTFTKSVSHNQDNRQEDGRYDNPTFGHAVPGSQKPDRSEQTPNDQQQPEIPQQEGNSKSDLLQEIRNFKKNNLRHTDVDDREASIAGSRKNNPSPLETLKDRIPYSPSPDPDIYNSDNQSASGAEWKESEQSFSVPKPNSKSESGSSSQIHAQPQVDPEQPKRSLENIEQSDQTPPENLLKEIRDRSQQDNRGLRQVDPTDKLSQDKEDGLQKDNLADVKTVEGPTVSVSASTSNSISDSGYISPTNNDSKSQTDLKQVGRKLEEHINLTLFEELKNTLGQENLGLKPADQSQISEETKKRLREDGLLKDSSTDVKTNDSGYSSPTHANHEQSQVNPGQLKASLMNVEQRDDTLLTEFTSKLDKETQKFPLKPVDQRGISEETKKRLREDGLLKDSSTDVKTNDSGYSSPIHANHEQSQVNPEQLKASLMNVEQKDDTLLTEFTSKLDKETQKFPLKPVDQRGISEQTKEHLLAAGLLKDSSTDVKTVAERENADTSPTVDKNSELYKLLEKDKIQLEVGVIKEEREDTLTEHTDSCDRDRIALGNRNKRPLDWTKRIAESQKEKDTNKGISI